MYCNSTSPWISTKNPRNDTGSEYDIGMERPDPDVILARVKAEDNHRGKLKIFFGMAPGVGKTYAMLQEARQRQAEGFRVLVGVACTHGRTETQALLEGLEQVPLKK